MLVHTIATSVLFIDLANFFVKYIVLRKTRNLFVVPSIFDACSIPLTYQIKKSFFFSSCFKNNDFSTKIVLKMAKILINNYNVGSYDSEKCAFH